LLSIPFGPGIEEWTAVAVPEEAFEVPIGVARTVREGDDITVVSVSYSVHDCLRVAKELQGHGISCEVVDVRSVVPLDVNHIVSSVRKTGRLLVVDEDYGFAGLSGEIVAQVCESGVSLRQRPRRVTRRHLPIPYSRVLDDAVRPGPMQIQHAIEEMVGRSAPRR
jgi:pyruvate dehydrogenase E1 component beta subunit